VSDPTYKELLKFLKPLSDDEFEIEEAIYWFAADYHRGQTSNLYSALSASEYRPGIAQSRPSGEAKRLYHQLVQEFGSDHLDWEDDDESFDHKCQQQEDDDLPEVL
jgi:hypothetical protein